MANKKKNEEIIEKKSDNGYTPKKTHKGLIAALIICATVVVLVSVVLPIAFVVFVLFFSVENTKFTTIDPNTIEIDNVGIRVTVDDSRYDEADNCYILSTKTELIDKDKYKKASLLSDSMNVTYSFIDEEGYVVGSEELFIGNLESHDKWKQAVYYCGEYASSVKSFEVESVDAY